MVGAGVAVITDTIFVCGGYDGANHLVSVESYNVCTGHWSVVSNMNIPRCYVGACVLKGKLYVVAGFVRSTCEHCSLPAFCVIDMSLTAFPLRKFFKESLMHGPLNLCVIEKTVRVNDSPYFQFWSRTVYPLQYQ